MKLTIIGSSDAFDPEGGCRPASMLPTSGGQFPDRLRRHVAYRPCPRKALIRMKFRRCLSATCTAIISRGLVWWLIHAVHAAKRTAPLTITGPVGIEKRFITAAEALFPNSTTTARTFDMQFVEYVERQPLEIGGGRVTPFRSPILGRAALRPALRGRRKDLGVLR